MRSSIQALLLTLALVSVPGSLAAQNRPDSFLAAPLSPYAVFHAGAIEDSTAGLALEFVVIVRGPRDWWNTRTGYDVGRADSLPPGVYAQGWTVGPRAYRLRFDAAAQTLELFGHHLSLGTSNLVFVTLGVTPQDSVIVRLGPRIVVPVSEGIPVTDALLAASADVRAFAETPPRDAP